jgi:hypothetical protein
MKLFGWWFLFFNVALRVFKGSRFDRRLFFMWRMYWISQNDKGFTKG